MNISGTIYSYSFLCYRKMWLAYYGISKEQDNEFVAIGACLDNTSYYRKNREIKIDNIAIDYIENNIVYEIKKSNKNEQMAINQVKYYIYTLRKKGLEINKGCINYPLAKQRKIVYLENNDVIDIEERLKLIENSLSNGKPPKINKIPSCQNCAYYELCYI